MQKKLSRREMLARSGASLGAGVAAVSCSAPVVAASEDKTNEKPFGYCLNTATIRGHKLPLDEEVKIAAEAGYDGIEPWTGNIRRYVDGGGSLADMRKRIADLGLRVVSAIGFPRWAVDDDARRAEGVEQLKQEMELVAEIGGRHIAAPPAGINRTPDVDLRKVAERYRTVLEMGREMGVVPQLEIWGSAITLGTVAEAAFVVVAADHPDACLLLDAYHMYRGGSGFACLKLLNGAAMHAFHINDYPADPPREEINDSHRVYPGDGVCKLDGVLKTLHQTGFRGMLSLELFNRTYWEEFDAQTIAKTGLEKTRAVVERALG